MPFRLAACFLAVSSASLAQSAPRYDLVQQKSSHNAYARDESLFDQLVFHRIRSLELDIWQSQNFAVNHNGSGEQGSNCSPLQNCLAMLAAFHQATPQHEVVTVWLEPTDYQGNNPPKAFPSQILDGILVASLGREALFTPLNLNEADCKNPKSPSLAAQVATCGFPTTDALRGKFIFVLMDANPGETLALTQYLAGGAATDRVAFLGSDPNNPIKCPGCIVFHNVNGGVQKTNPYFAKGPDARNCCGGDGDGCSARSNADWSTELAANTQHPGTNCINYQTTPWAITHNGHGWPFKCLTQDCNAKMEINDLIGMLVHSGDIENDSDDFGFAYEELPAEENVWQMDALVSSAGSKSNEWAKGCLMARSQPTPGSPYFAVCRPDRHMLRIQYRTEPGKGTTILESNISPSSNASAVHLEATRNGEQTCFVGSLGIGGPPLYSKSVCIAGRFSLRGLAASSHGDANRLLLFAHVRVTAGGVTTGYSKAKLPASIHIGKLDGGSMVSFDGPFAGASL